MTNSSMVRVCGTALLAWCLAAGCFGSGGKGGANSSTGGRWLACSDDGDCVAQGSGARCSEGICVDAAGEPITVTAGSAGSGDSAGTNGGTAGTASVGGTGGTGGTAGACTDCCAGVPNACESVNCDCGPVAASGGVGGVGGSAGIGGTGAAGTTAGSSGTGGTGSVCEDCCAGIPNPSCAFVDCACPPIPTAGTNADPTVCMVGADCADGEVCVYSGGFTAMPGGTCQPNPCAGQELSCTCAESLCTVGTCSQAKERVVDCVCPNC